MYRFWFHIFLLVFALRSVTSCAFAQGVETAPSTYPQLALQLGHRRMVADVAISPDGRILASAGESVKLWDVRSGMLLHTLESPRYVTALAWSPDGQTIVGAGDFEGRAGKLWFWQAQSGQLLRTWNEPTALRTAWSTPEQADYSNIFCLAFSPDGRILATGSGDYTIKLRDPQTGAVQRTLGTHDDFVNRLAFSSDGKQLVSAGQDNVLKVWDVLSGELKRSWKAFETQNYGGLYGLAFAPDSQTIAAGGGDNIIRLWGLDGRLQREWKGHEQPVSSLAFSPDGQTLVSTGADNTVKLWNARNGVLIRSLSRPNPNTAVLYSGTVIAMRRSTKTGNQLIIGNVASFSPDGRWIALGNFDRSVELWDATGRANSRVFRGQQDAWSISLSPDGRYLASSGGFDNSVRLWDAHTSTLLRHFKGHTEFVFRVAFSPDGRTLLSSSWDKTARLWDVESGALRRTFQTQAPLARYLAFSPDGKTIAVSSSTTSFGNSITPDWNWYIELFNVADGTKRHMFTGQGTCFGLAFSPLRSEIAAAINSRESNADIMLWDSTSGKLKQSYEASGEIVASLAFSPDGRTLVGGSTAADASGNLLLWDVLSGELRRTLQGHASSVLAVAVSPDGKTIASGSTDTTVKLWDAASGDLQRTLIGHQSYAQDLAFSTNGKFLASASRDCTLRFWLPSSGRLLATLLPMPQVEDVTRSARPTTIGARPIDLGAKATEMAGNEWFAVTPEGYFDCSANAAKFIKWRVGDQLFPAERYYRKFRRPDIVQKALRGEAIDAPRMTGEDIPPSTQFVSLKYEGAGKATSREILITLEAHGQREISEVLLWVNGRPLPPESEKPIQINDVSANLPARPIEIGSKPIEIGSKPIEIGSKSEATETEKVKTPVGGMAYKINQRCTFRVLLPAGSSEVKVRAVAYDTGQLGSSPTEILLNNAAAKPMKGRLYALCIGLSRYANGKNTSTILHKGEISNLKYPAIDAQSLATRLQTEGAPLYQSVEVKTLTNEQATLPNIRAALRWLQESVQPGQIDTVVLCMSGHGVSDPQGRYFFPAYEFDAQNYRETSLAGSELQQELGGKLRAKDVFLFVDTCHSGALLGARSDDLNFEVDRGGVYLIASSGATQYSYESSEWGHGAFTYAMLRSLSKKELAHEGVIHFNVLTYAIPDEIAHLLHTAGQNEDAMVPVIPIEGRFLDAPIVQTR